MARNENEAAGGGQIGQLGEENLGVWLEPHPGGAVGGQLVQEEEVENQDEEAVAWRDLVMQDEDDDGFESRWGFEHIKTFKMGPNDDWQICLTRHAKVELDPAVIYEVNSPVVVTNPFYIIGNGAKVVIKCSGRAFTCLLRDNMPLVVNMWSCTFFQCHFIREGNSKDPFFGSYRSSIIQECHFVGFLGNVLDFNCTGVVRACNFLGCLRAVQSCKTFAVRIKGCKFEKCVQGVNARGRAVIKRCIFEGCCYPITMFSTGSIIGCVVNEPPESSPLSTVRMVTCSVGGVMPLSAVHVAGNRAVDCVKMEGCMFSGTSVYVGQRRSAVNPVQCSFFYSIIYLDRKMMKKFCGDGVYTTTLMVKKVNGLSTSTDGVFRVCLCGESHESYPLLCTDVTKAILPNFKVHSCDSGEYSSEEDDF